MPSSPSTLGAEQSDDDEDDEELRGRWGNNGVVVGGGEKGGARQGNVSVDWRVVLWLCAALGERFCRLTPVDGRPPLVVLLYGGEPWFVMVSLRAESNELRFQRQR